METLNETVIWRRGDETLNIDLNENKTTETLENREVVVIVNTLVVEKAGPRHAGNYSCIVPGKAKVTVAVHVLNGKRILCISVLVFCLFFFSFSLRVD